MSNETALAQRPGPGSGAAWHQELSVVVPSYNGRELLRQTLETFFRLAPDAEVVVSDGSSTDGSAAMVREKFPQAKVVDHPNHGFAHANNVGIAECTRRFILLLNSDLFLTEAALEAMHRRLADDPKVGAVAPNLANVDGSRQSIFGGLYWPLWRPIAERRSVKLLSMACLMTRRDVLQAAGGLDENLFLYNEEHDWCRTVRDRGFTLELLGPQVVHVGGGSTKRSPILTLEERRGFLYVAQKHRWPTAFFLKLLMGLQAFALRFLDPRADWRKMWSKQWAMIQSGDLLASPFPISGRGANLQPAGSAQRALPASGHPQPEPPKALKAG
ncbi:MAG: glycosyltransferase family 2 protein [Myxococcales bacterium]